ncbi:MAG TPA: SDR family NAD(P)-dependent oxidoreductase [Bacillota bacterium]
MNWSGRRVLVTGAGGFIGSHLTERLVELGAEVRALVRYTSTGSAGWLETSRHRREIEVIGADITDREMVRRAARGSEVVFHLAALIGIPYSYHAPESYVRTNVEGTLVVLQSALACDVGRFVHTSTSEVYGTARRVPIDEGHPLQAQSPYSATKIAADKLAESFHLSFGLPVAILRPFNTYGPRQSARAVIPTIITQCLTGDVVRLGSLHPTRDLTYVADTVEGFLRAAERPEAVGQTIHLGTGQEISVGDLARLIADLAGRSIRIETQEERVRPAPSEVERLLADNTRARSLLGWTPRVSLTEGLRRTIEWIAGHIERYRVDEYAV